MRAYRIVKPRWAATAMDGEGARIAGGRWNPPGLPVVYLAESRALAALEMLVHLDRLARQMPLVLIEVEFPDSLITEVIPADLSDGWDRTRGTDALKRLGADWLRGMQSFAMRVPSVVIPDEANFLINPRHPDAAKIKVAKPVPWRFDARFLAAEL